MIAARLAEHPGEDPFELGRKVVAGYLALRKDGTFPWKKYLRPETLFAASKFESYLEAAPRPRPDLETEEEAAARIKRERETKKGGPSGGLDTLRDLPPDNR